MNWSSVSDFFSMGGYAAYVWGSMVVVALLVVGEVLQLWLSRPEAAPHEVDRQE